MNPRIADELLKLRDAIEITGGAPGVTFDAIDANDIPILLMPL